MNAVGAMSNVLHLPRRRGPRVVLTGITVGLGLASEAMLALANAAGRAAESLQELAEAIEEEMDPEESNWTRGAPDSPIEMPQGPDDPPPYPPPYTQPHP